MLSFPCTNNRGALEQVIYPSIAPVEMFSMDDCVFYGKIRDVYLHGCDTGKKNKQTEGSSNSDKKGCDY